MFGSIRGWSLLGRGRIRQRTSGSWGYGYVSAKSTKSLDSNSSRQRRQRLDHRLGGGNNGRPLPDKLRVAVATLERKIVKKFNILLRAKHYLVVDGYDPRIHALYFCPQLYKSDSNGTLVALEGEEIGKLLAKLVEGAVAQKQPWYDPAEKSPNKRIISATPWQTWTASSSIPQPGNHYSSRSRVPPRRMRASSQRLKVRRSLQRRQSDPARRLLGQQSIPRMTNQAHHRPALARDHREAELA